jgi:hypothetical protein
VVITVMIIVMSVGMIAMMTALHVLAVVVAMHLLEEE